MHDFAIKTSFCLKFIVWKLLLAMLYKMKYSGMKNVCTSGKYMHNYHKSQNQCKGF